MRCNKTTEQQQHNNKTTKQQNNNNNTQQQQQQQQHNNNTQHVLRVGVNPTAVDKYIIYHIKKVRRRNRERKEEYNTFKNNS
jgi:hypothetical protein